MNTQIVLFFVLFTQILALKTGGDFVQDETVQDVHALHDRSLLLLDDFDRVFDKEHVGVEEAFRVNFILEEGAGRSLLSIDLNAKRCDQVRHFDARFLRAAQHKLDLSYERALQRHAHDPHLQTRHHRTYIKLTHRLEQMHELHKQCKDYYI